ncbi:PoNe immunity protein domain-containing protein [Pseudomonas fakonensis]|uniref:PoNe immunity protein domain-containing protein n=1 Tax=Pseudomonas fakonensis TaxID=2842355 RepID=UPI001CED6248|nr:PoNe immunity protein domain-containing protein [Pseudomonas fakonensis]
MNWQQQGKCILQRRQPFITDSYYRHLAAFHDSIKARLAEQPLPGETAAQSASLTAARIKMSAFKNLMLRYTAGEDISVLGGYLQALVEAYEAYQCALAEYHGELDISPLNIRDALYEYQEFVQVVSFCVLLHRDDLLTRFVRLTDRAGFYCQDVLYEDLLKKRLPGRYEVDEFYHAAYRSLIEAVYAETADCAAERLSAYCRGWYSGFADVANYWHDSHLTMTETDGAYFGYWALEAAAIAYLYDIDDSAVDHMVYPRDLIEYARAFDISQASAAGEVN